MSDAQVVFTGNADQLLAEHKKIEDAKNKEIAGLKALLSESKKTYGEDAKLMREKQAALDKARTAQQVYNDQVQKWFNLMAQGKITSTEFNRLKDIEAQKLKDATRAINAESDALRKSEGAKRADASAARMSESSTFSMGGAFTKVAAVVATATMAIRAFSAEQKRLQDETAGTVTSIDEMSRTYAVQAGIKPGEMRGQRDQILAIAEENAVSPEKAFQAATQLVSSGFEDPVKSGTLDSFLKTMATSNLKGGDPVQLAQAMSQFMGAYGIGKTQENMLDLGVKMRGLFKDTDVQVADLSEFAKAAPGLAAANIPLDESLAMLTELRKTMAPGEAATGIRNVVGLLRTAGGEKKKAQTLKEMGLAPADVDMVGETATVALTRFRDGLNKLPEEDRAIAMKNVFGQENLTAGQRLIDSIDQFDKNKQSMRDLAGFAQGVETAQSGDAARKMRTRVRQETARLQNEDIVSLRDFINDSEQRKYEQAVADVESSGMTPFEKKVAKAKIYAGKKSLDTVRTLTGQNPEDVYQNKLGLVTQFERETNQQFSEKELRKRLGPNAPPVNGLPNIGFLPGPQAAQVAAPAAPAAPAADPQAAAMAEQNALLRQSVQAQQDIKAALTNPANKPPVNPTLTGRTDQ